MKPIKLPKEVVALLEPRLKDEFKAFYFYRSAANWCNNVGFKIAGEYFSKESDDELKHAKGIEKFLVDWNVTPSLPDIDPPELEFKSLGDLIEQAYTIERELYEEYEETSSKVFLTGDLCAFDFLQTYRTIQKDSVAEYSDMINALTGVDTNDKFKMLVLEENLFNG